MLRWCVALGLLGVVAHANLDFPDPKVVARDRARARAFHEERDFDALVELMEESHLFVKTDIGLMLGRSGVRKALPALRKLDEFYADFPCCQCGEFGVAVILIENPGREKEALLKVALEPIRGDGYPESVIDKAGRELDRFDDPEVAEELKDVKTYGAQFTVLSTACRRLPDREGIARARRQLEWHKTPLLASAAGDVLIRYGNKAEAAVADLKKRAEKKIKSGAAGPWRTIHNRCDRILAAIGKR